MFRYFLLVFSLVITLSHAQTKNLKTLISPPFLKKGDTIIIITPASAIQKKNRKYIEQGKNLAESWGLNVVYGKHLFNRYHHFAGTDIQRSKDFQKALDNPNIKAIWCAKGGYGSVRILDLLDFSKFKKHPKWIIGYSDITAIHNQVHNLGFETLHALMPTSLKYNPSDTKKSINTLKKALFKKKLLYTISSSKYNKKGKAKGRLIGGNLTLLVSMLGSKSSISTSGNILFFEDVREYKYQIDRMLQSLKRAGYFENCKGVIVGNMTDIKNNSSNSWGSSIETLILNVLSKYNFPILFDFPAGHEADNRTLILGRNITLKVGKKKSSIIFK